MELFKKITLHTARLDLRLFNENDLSDFYEYARVEGVGEPAGWAHHKTIEETKNILKCFIENKDTLAIVYKENNKVIGSIGVTDPHTANYPNGLIGKEIGFVLSKSYWNMGIMTEAIREVIRYVLLDLKLDYIVGACSKANNKSKRVFEKNNFKYNGDLYFNNYNSTKILSDSFILLRNDYLEKCEKIQVYDYSFNKLNTFIYRGEMIKGRELRGVVDVVIYNEKYDKYLVTRRDRNKDVYPNMLETTGGAITYGETEIFSAKREVEEETGITDIKLKFLYKYYMDNTKALYFIFYGTTKCELDSIKLQEGETTEYKWLDFDNYYTLWHQSEVNPNQKVRIMKALDDIKDKSIKC